MKIEDVLKIEMKEVTVSEFIAFIQNNRGVKTDNKISQTNKDKPQIHVLTDKNKQVVGKSTVHKNTDPNYPHDNVVKYFLV